MMAETKTEENTLHRFLQEMLQEILQEMLQEILQEMLQEILQEMFQLVVLVEEICTRFYSSKRINLNLISFNGYLVFRERGLDSALHKKCQKRLKITWSSHVIFD